MIKINTGSFNAGPKFRISKQGIVDLHTKGEIYASVSEQMSTSVLVLQMCTLPHSRLKDIGLEKFDTATLFKKLLTPTTFVIIICIQLNYFQKSFLEISDVNRFR